MFEFLAYLLGVLLPSANAGVSRQAAGMMIDPNGGGQGLDL